MLIAISAIVPSIFMVIPMVTAVIVTFAWPQDAADDKAYQSQYKGAIRNTLCFCHGSSYAADSITYHDPLMVAIRNRFVGAVPRLSNNYFSAHELPAQSAGRPAYLTIAVSFSSPGDAICLSFPGHSDLPFAHPFDPLSAPRAGLERIRKVLGFPRNLGAAELHDAHGVGGLPVIRQNELGDPKITAANDSPHSEALAARLIGTRYLYVAPTADSLA
jgi:hypothetical protein